ncbi:MAG TPA: hypothetical protein VJT73_05800 [Polyangiaceae bacterium]|nr:hypothetical protein [Polyangiaceae bacterium]
MSKLAALTLVWLGAEPAEVRAKEALDAWAAQHGAELAEPSNDEAPDDPALPAMAEQSDRTLEAARDMANAGDEDGARQALAELEQTLRSHPGLPQASWLLAERYRLEAQILARGPAPSKSASAAMSALADALEGERAVSFGEAPKGATSVARIDVTLVVHGARRPEVFWDGVLSSTNRLSTVPGEHHLVVRRGKRAAWSGWVSALATGNLDVWVPDARPCSREDLEGVATSGAALTVPRGIRCGAWIAAGPARDRGTLGLWRCEGSVCQLPTVAVIDKAATDKPPLAAETKQSRLPAWAAWTLAGVGAVAATSLVLWGTGAFDRAPPQGKVAYDGSRL